MHQIRLYMFAATMLFLIAWSIGFVGWHTIAGGLDAVSAANESATRAAARKDYMTANGQPLTEPQKMQLLRSPKYDKYRRALEVALTAGVCKHDNLMDAAQHAADQAVADLGFLAPDLRSKIAGDLERDPFSAKLFARDCREQVSSAMRKLG